MPRVYAQDTVIFEQAGLKVSLERIPSPLRGAWAPLICVCRARLGQLSISLQVDKQLGSKKKLRGRERSLEREVQVLIDGKPVRTLARQSANSETNCDSKN